MKTLAQQWDDFARRVLPPSAPGIQRQEMKRAFFAGAASLLDALMVGLDPGVEPTPADLARMDAIHAELRQFYEDARSGFA